MSPPPRKQLPIGVQTFRTIREGGYYDVDKTGFLRDLVERGTHYVLSRPRRFGKSLFLDTVKELFEGAEGLFRDLEIHSHWDWSGRHPVLRLSFGRGHFKREPDVRAQFGDQIDQAAHRYGVEIVGRTASGRFASLLEAVHRATDQRVVVLVDEYDKPILDALADRDVARSTHGYKY